MNTMKRIVSGMLPAHHIAVPMRHRHKRFEDRLLSCSSANQGKVAEVDVAKLISNLPSLKVDAFTCH